MTDWTTGKCEANGIEIHYHRTGGNKPPVVLLHGLMLNGACWTGLARSLQKDYDVIMPDARGHGHTGAPNQGYSYEHLAADVVSFINVLELAPPVLIGHSMGGMTAAVVASQYANQLRGLVLVDPAFLAPQRQREVYESDVAAQHRRILNGSKEIHLTQMLAQQSRRSREVIELFAQARFQTSMNAFEILRPPYPDYVQLISTITVPSLLIIGDIGSVISLEVSTELANLNEYLEVVQITEAGHAVPYDQPDRFATVVQTFLQSINLFQIS